MTSPTCAHVRRVGLCAGVVTGAVSLLVPVAAAQAPSAPGAAGAAGMAGAAERALPRAPAEVEPGDSVALAPDPAVPGSAVLIRADCARGTGEGIVYSPAFTSTASLRPATDRTAPWRAEATLKSGARPGERYVVTANCGGRQSLTSSFTVRAPHSPATRPAGEATAAHPRSGVGPRRYEESDAQATIPDHGGHRADARSDAGSDADTYPDTPARRQQDGVDNTALAMGGGLATVGLAGYLLTLRRGNEQRRNEPPGDEQRDNERRDRERRATNERRGSTSDPRGNAVSDNKRQPEGR